MTTTRKTSTTAALLGTTAALALLSGVAGARADDLQVNQRLLDTRIDQLAAVGQNAGPAGGAVFSVDQNKAAGQPVTAGSFPRSILIPGTDTSLRIGGQIVLTTDYFLNGSSQPNGLPNTDIGANGLANSIPVAGSAARSRGNGIFWESVRESKIGFETRTPTPFGEARTYMEFDWNGPGGANAFYPGGAAPQEISDSLGPRLKYAYGTLGGLLAGQATSNFSDPDANSETLDFGGNVGDPGHVRIPQIRYTMPAWWGSSFSVSAESPETVIATAAGRYGSDAGFTNVLCSGSTTVVAGCTLANATSGPVATNVAKATAPDLTAALYFPQPWGHVDISAVLRPGLEIQDGKFISDTFIGYGGHIGFDVKPGWFGWFKDDITGHFVAGSAIGGYLNESSNFDLATNYGATVPATAAAVIRATPTTETGWNIGYQHWWLDNLRSNINAGWNYHDVPVNLVGYTQGSGLNKRVTTAHANLIWNPVSFVDVGIEYMFGYRQTVSGATAVLGKGNGSMNTIIGKFAFRF